MFRYDMYIYIYDSTTRQSSGNSVSSSGCQRNALLSIFYHWAVGALPEAYELIKKRQVWGSDEQL